MIRRKSKSQSTYSHRRSLCTVYDTHIWKKKMQLFNSASNKQVCMAICTQLQCYSPLF